MAELIPWSDRAERKPVHPELLTRDGLEELLGGPVAAHRAGHGRSVVARRVRGWGGLSDGIRSGTAGGLNLGASALCGAAVFGDAVLCLPGDPVEWPAAPTPAAL